MDTISGFHSEYAWLSNFWPARIEIQDWVMPSAEHCYQAAKSLDARDWREIQQMTAGQAKKYGRRVICRPDWHEVKLPIMTEIVTLKFEQHPHLMAKLLATGDIKLIEENYWNDTFWGVCNNKGYNHLGRILMRVRAQFQSLNNEERKVG